MKKLKFKSKKYDCVGWSSIEIREDDKFWSRKTEECLNNASFYTPKYGYDYLPVIDEFLIKFISQYGTKFIFNEFPDTLFITNTLLKGTFIFKKENEE